MSVGLVGAAALLWAAYASAWERRWIEVTRRRVPLRGLPAGLDGFTIAHLSDLHYGPLLPAGQIERAVARTNALAPDVVALTGDLVDLHPWDVEPAARALAGLRARLGVYAVLGGHDVTAGERLCDRAFGEAGIRVLSNEAASLADGLWVAGVRDNSEYYLDRLGTALAGVPDGAHTVLLAHSPDIALEARDAGVDLVLSGHTHGGQVCAPLYGPILTESRFGRRFARGLNRAGRTWVYTSRGIGAVRLPMRFLCRPEIGLLTLAGCTG